MYFIPKIFSISPLNWDSHFYVWPDIKMTSCRLGLLHLFGKLKSRDGIHGIVLFIELMLSKQFFYLFNLKRKGTAAHT